MEIIGYKLNNGFGFTMLETPRYVNIMQDIERFEREKEQELGNDITVDAVYRKKIVNKTTETGKK